MNSMAAIINSQDVLPRGILDADRVLGRRPRGVDVHFTFAFVDPEPGHVPILIKGLSPFIDGDGVVQREGRIT